MQKEFNLVMFMATAKPMILEKVTLGLKILGFVVNSRFLL